MRGVAVNKKVPVEYVVALKLLSSHPRPVSESELMRSTRETYEQLLEEFSIEPSISLCRRPLDDRVPEVVEVLDVWVTSRAVERFQSGERSVLYRILSKEFLESVVSCDERVCDLSSVREFLDLSAQRSKKCERVVTDFFGQPLSVGDRIAFVSKRLHCLQMGRVKEFTDKRVRVCWTTDGRESTYLTRPEFVVKRNER